MRVVHPLLIALALLCVCAAQPSAAPVTLSFSYEHTAFPQPNAAQPTVTTQHEQAIVDDTPMHAATPHSQLHPPVVSSHPSHASHTLLSSANDTNAKAANSTSDIAPVAGAMSHNSTKDGMATMGKEDAAKASGNRSGNSSEPTVREKEREREKAGESGEKKEGAREEKFPDEPSQLHNNITHGNRTGFNHSQ